MAEIGGFVVVVKSPSGVQVVPKWSTSDLSLSYLISSKRLLFKKYGIWRAFSALYLAVPGCNLLYLAQL